MDYSNIPTGLKITSQIPLDTKEWCKNEATLAYLGVDDNLAFTYHDGIEILCIEEKTLYKWREVQPGEENTGLIPLDYTYPLGLPNVYGLNYSGKTYNFFQIEYITTENINENINIDNVGSGAKVYKGYNSITNKHEFRTVVQENQGAGVSFLRDIEQTTDELKVRVKTLVSDNLTITATDEEVRIETPSTASIPALYVNNLYEPTYQEWLTENKKQNSGTAVAGFQFRGKGTLAQPFTDTIVYTLNQPLTPPTTTVNTAIQNALDAYVGTGLGADGINPASRLNPKLKGQKIIIQDNNTQYFFAGDFGYSRLNIEVYANIIHTSSGKIFDMDNATHFNALQDSITITIGEAYFIASEGDGAYNSGSNVATNNFAQSRIAFLKGKGTLYFPNNNIIKYGINSDILGSGNNNDGNVTFLIECTVRSDYQGVYKIGGNSRIYVYGKLVSGISSITIDPMLKAFMHLGGQVRFFEGSEIKFGATTRTDGFVFTPTGGFTPTFIGNSPTIESYANTTNLFNKTTTDNVNFTLINSQSGVLLDTTNIFKSPNIWNVVFRNNVFESGYIDTTKVDLTNGNSISSTNTIGSNIIESLVVYNNRANALSAGVPLYSAYLKTSGVAYPATAGWVRDIVLPA